MAIVHQHDETLHIRSVPMTRPFIWLREGWDDLMHHRGASIAYGVLVSLLGALILAYGRHPFFLAAAASGFLLVGPILTAGLCELSRCQDQGERADFQSSLMPLQRNRSSLLGELSLLPGPSQTIISVPVHTPEPSVVSMSAPTSTLRICRAAPKFGLKR